MTVFYDRITYLLLLFIVLCSATGCYKKDSGPIPTYVHVDSFTVNPPSTFPGDLQCTNQVKAVWAYYNDNLIGVYDLPATIPVIASGTGKLTLRGGIAVSGFNNFMAAYPFYTSDTSSLVAQPGKTVHYNPKVTYYAATQFLVIASFNPFKSMPFQPVNSTVPVTMSLSDGIGHISLRTPVDTLAEDSSVLNFPIPLNKDAYIELDYKCTVPFYLGLRANLAGLIYTKYYLAGIYPSDHWQKFYLAVKDFEAQYQATDYNLFIKASLPEGQDTGTVLLDNIQLVYFN